MVITVQPLSYLLNYSGSTLAPITMTSIYYNQTGQNIHYEDLYYSQNTVIGCRRYNALGVIPGTAGSIQITNVSASDAQQSWAAANAAMRVWLDLWLQQSPVNNLIVPLSAWDNMISAFSKCGLQAYTITLDQSFPEPNLLVTSEPVGNNQYVHYDDSNTAVQ